MLDREKWSEPNENKGYCHLNWYIFYLLVAFLLSSPFGEGCFTVTANLDVESSKHIRHLVESRHLPRRRLC
ncbi:hypothetical protein Y032_0112g330 [Ancylostoma ceylanicum]|uniref:Uncharacterized protein n=1 Tax=Ancylostoma ceylanicum TaxID=53326 RepID=A0A016TDZ5_9BILA|nr:hypothetical protein Y032_0112g330 [Ancylostoma ceylanicum]